MTTSTLFATTANTIASHHGNLSSITSSQVMDTDINSYRSYPLEHQEDQDAMDTSLDVFQNNERTTKQVEAGATVMSISQSSDATLERPREGDIRSAVLEQKAHVPSKPYLTQDLLSLFGLQTLAASVARTDPATGEKINKMRKSYEGKVKAFGLAGRNRAIKHEPGKSLGLMELVTWPEEEWQNQKVLGKDVHKGLSTVTVAKLEKAMQMQPGPLPNNNEWEDLLGHEKSKPVAAIADQSKKPSHPGTPIARVNGLTNGARAEAGKSSTTELIRPKRTGKKRRYDEHSFEGYGEGYVDDDGDVMVGGGYSSGDASRKGTTSKKRKKDYGPSNPAGLGDRKGNYGVGMVGVSSGIGTYGR